MERAMIVFEYMYDMMKVFGPLMDKKAGEKHCVSDCMFVML